MHTRRVVVMVLVLAAAAVAQTTVMGSGRTLVSLRPDLVLLAVITFAMVRGAEEGTLAGLLGGFMVDSLSVAPFGAAAFALGALGLATGMGEANVYRANAIVQLVAVFVATILYHSFLMLSLQGAGWRVDWLVTLALQTVPGAFFNTLLAPLAIPLVRRITASPEESERMRW